MYPKRRVKVQGHTEFEILAEANDKITAGNLEIEFQKKYGYTLDKVKYYETNYKSMGQKGGAKCVELGYTKKLQKIGSKIASKLPRTESQIEQGRKLQRIGAPIAWSLPRSEKQMAVYKAKRTKKQIETSILNGKIQGALRKEQLRVPIAAYKKSDNSYISQYDSVTDCARELNIKSPEIFACLSGRQKSTKGYTFIKLKK